MTAPAHLEIQLPSSLPVGVPREGSRLARARTPRAKQVLRETAIEFGVCVQPILMRRSNVITGETEPIELPCCSTRAAKCPPCADRARRLRAQQCREGWHLTEEPDFTPDPARAGVKDLVADRALITEARDQAIEAGDLGTVEACDESLADVDAQLEGLRVRGSIDPPKTSRRVKSTKRRSDVPDLPRRKSTGSSLGRVYADPRTGKEFRPSLFVTLTLPSYGRVHADDGTPVHPPSYDYARAAKDAIHFGKLLDRFAKNMRRVAGYEAQYFAAVEPQRRAAPHAHYAIRGTLPRATVREVAEATYANVWWPSTGTVYYAGDRLPVWDEDRAGYVDPDTRQPLVTWAEALDQVNDDPDAQPMHTVRFGTQVDVKGVLAGSEQAEKAIGYLVKYLVKDLGEDLSTPAGADPDDQNADGPPARRSDTPARKAAAARRADHIDRLVEALRFEPCAPTCANWLRYGVQPKNARPRLRPEHCTSKAHRPSHLGYGGRRVLVSRKWTGKDLTDHRYDRKAHVLAILGRTAELSTVTDPDTRHGIRWEKARTTDPDIPTAEHRLLRRVAEQVRRRHEYHRARDGSNTPDRQQGTESAAPAAQTRRERNG